MMRRAIFAFLRS